MKRACFSLTNKIIDLVTMANYMAMNCAYLENRGLDISEYERQITCIEIKFNQLRQDLRVINDQISEDYELIQGR